MSNLQTGNAAARAPKRNPFEIALAKSDEIRRAYDVYARIDRRLREFEDREMVTYVNTDGITRTRRADRCDALEAMDVDGLTRAIEVLEKQARGPTVPRELEAMLCLALAAIPSAAKFDSTALIDALVALLMSDDGRDGSAFDLPASCDSGGFTAPVISSAVRQIISTATFVPAIPEFLAVFRQQRGVMLGAAESGKRLLKERAEKLARRLPPGADAEQLYRDSLEALSAVLHGRRASAATGPLALLALSRDEPQQLFQLADHEPEALEEIEPTSEGEREDWA
jgi:hypothetical protein